MPNAVSGENRAAWNMAATLQYEPAGRIRVSLSRPIVIAQLALVAIGCASMKPAPRTSIFTGYQRLYLTMPSHAAGYGITAPLSTTGWIIQSVSGGSTRPVVDQAFHALRDELINAGFDIVATDGEADAVLELTVGGVRPSGDADRAFVAFRDAGTGRLLAFFRARSREDPQAVDDLIEGIVQAIAVMVREPPRPPGTESF